MLHGSLIFATTAAERMFLSSSLLQAVGRTEQGNKKRTGRILDGRTWDEMPLAEAINGSWLASVF
jgi:protein gp37